MRTRLGVPALALAALLVAWGLWAAYLAVLADEGPVPPGSRLPDAPAGVTVVSEDQPCASGGCWREVVLRPADGSTPADLAADLGLTDADHQGWRPLDPASVVVSATPVGDELRVVAQYDGLG